MLRGTGIEVGTQQIFYGGFERKGGGKNMGKKGYTIIAVPNQRKF
jgi:hypothetical protein